MFVGTLDQDVLESHPMRDRPLRLERIGGQLRLTAGVPAGLIPGTILAVHPPDASQTSAHTTLAYVRVTSATALYSDLESIAFREITTPLDPGRLPPSSTCSIVRQQLGDRRLRIAVADCSDVRWEPYQRRLQAVLSQVAENMKPQLCLVQESHNAEWILRLVDPPGTRGESDAAKSTPIALLAVAHHPAARAVGRADVHEFGPATSPRVYSCCRYQLSDPQPLASDTTARPATDLPLGRSLAIGFYEAAWQLNADSFATERSGT